MMPQTPSAYTGNLQKIFDDSRIKKFPKDQIINYQGDILKTVYFMRGGYVKAYIILDSGETRTMFLLAKGDVFPLTFSLATSWAEETIKYFYEAMTDIEVATLEVSELKTKIDTQPHATTALLAYLAAANEAVINQLESTKSKSAEDKVAASLPYIANKVGRQTANGVYTLDLKLSHQDIADLCGVTRETVSVAIKSLENKGLIERKNKDMIIKLS